MSQRSADVLAGIIVFAVIAVIAGGIGGVVWFFHDEHATLRKGLKEKNGLAVKKIELTAPIDGVRYGSLVTDNGETLPLAVRVTSEQDKFDSRRSVTTTAWLVGKTQKAAEAEIRGLAEKMEVKVASMTVQPNPGGVGHSGELTAVSGEVYDVTEVFSGSPLSSKTLVRMRPSSHPRWITNAVEADVKEPVASLSPLVAKATSWKQDEAAAKAKADAAKAKEDVAAGAVRMAAFEARMKKIRDMGREPTATDVAAARALTGYKGIDIDALLRPSGADAIREQLAAFDRERARTSGTPPAPKPEPPTFYSAVAVTKGGKIYEVEFEVGGAPAHGLNARWRPAE